MSTVVLELYEALRSAGVADDVAKAAARAVLSAEDKAQLATKADLAELQLATKADLAELKTSLIQWTVGTFAVMTGVFGAIVGFTR